MVGVVELGHVVFYVGDLERSRAFYRDVLGFPELPGAGRGFAAFSGGRTHHELLLIEVGPDAPPPPRGRHRGLYHVGFKVGDSDDDLRSMLAGLRAHDVRIVGASDHTVSHSIYIEDPDGNELELYVDVPGVNWRKAPELVLSPIRPLAL
jgi:catechol 2,3-dioxygenase